MDLQKVLGFPLDKVRIDPDGTSTPPEVSPLSPPTNPRGRAAPEPRQLEATRIEGLQAPPPPPTAAAPSAVPAPAAVEGRTGAAPMAAAAAAPAGARALVAAAEPARAPARKVRAGGLGVRWRRLLRDAREGVEPPPRWGLIALSSALMGFGMAVLVALLARGARPSEDQGPRPTQAQPAAAPTPRSEPARRSQEPCARQREPELVARGVSSSFALEARALPGSVDVLLGLSLAGGTALGLQLNATTLSATELVREHGSRELLGVVPTPSTSPPGFAIDRASVGGFRDWRSLPEHPGWALARTNRALNLVEVATRRATALWPLSAGEELTRPRLERLDASRWALVLRRGGRRGELVLGWLDPQRGTHSELRALPFTGSELGLPALATSRQWAAVAAATRATSKTPWHVELATSEPDGRPRRIELTALETGPEHDSFAPSLAALAGARWFLQWTEGQRGLRRVRGVTLDAEFAPVGESIELSPPGASAGGGSVLSVDEGLLSLFLIQRGSSYELWATTLSCR